MKKHNKGKRGFMALKLDMSKVYDRMEWNFFKFYTRKLGFDQKWIKLIMKCVTFVSYSILLNGELQIFTLMMDFVKETC